MGRELRDDYGYRSVRLLDRDELQDHVRSDRYLAGLLDSRSGHLQPLKYTQGLARAAEAAGAVIYENSEVLRYEDGPRGARAYGARHGALRASRFMRQRLHWRGGAVAGAAHFGRRHVHHCHRTLG